jgi:hypothetical protein
MSSHHVPSLPQSLLAEVDLAEARIEQAAASFEAVCDVGIKHMRQEARAWVADLETLAARTGMSELLVRAHLHRNALGDRNAAEMAAWRAARPR